MKTRRIKIKLNQFWICAVIGLMLIALTAFVFVTGIPKTFKFDKTLLLATQTVAAPEPVAVSAVSNDYILEKNDDFVYLSPAEEHFDISGFPFAQDNSDFFYRLDQTNVANYPEGVASRASRAAGGRIRFKTDSASVHIRVSLDKIESYPHFALTGSAGIDVYAGNGSKKIYKATFSPENALSKTVDGLVTLSGSGELEEITVNLPLYSSINRIEIGFAPSALLASASPYEVEKPVVFYGSSITQGCSASRPGTSYPDLVTRSLDAGLVNLGFSSSAKGERVMAETIARIDMSALVLEYDHNAQTAEDLENTHHAFYAAIREKHPELPIILLSRCSSGYSVTEQEAAERNEVIRRTYDTAVLSGDENVFYIDGSSILPAEIRGDCLVDGVHPNDRGMALIADAILNILEEIIKKD